MGDQSAPQRARETKAPHEDATLEPSTMEEDGGQRGVWVQAG